VRGLFSDDLHRGRAAKSVSPLHFVANLNTDRSWRHSYSGAVTRAVSGASEAVKKGALVASFFRSEMSEDAPGRG